MGYTHYWNSIDFTCREWAKIKTAAKKIIAESSVKVTREYDDNRPPIVSDNLIRFNGVGDDGHETFLIKHLENEWGFCKTARKDYDAIVVALLIAISSIVPRFNWSSDGFLDEHADGLHLFNKATGNSLRESNCQKD